MMFFCFFLYTKRRPFLLLLAVTAGLVLADAINRAGSAKPEAIRVALRATDIKGDQTIMPWREVRRDRAECRVQPGDAADPGRGLLDDLAVRAGGGGRSRVMSGKASDIAADEGARRAYLGI